MNPGRGVRTICRTIVRSIADAAGPGAEFRRLCLKKMQCLLLWGGGLHCFVQTTVVVHNALMKLARFLNRRNLV